MKEINKLDTTGSWAVDGSPIYTPSAGIRVEHTNLAGSDTGRTEDGIMHIDWIRRDIRKIHLKYSAVSSAELNNMMSRMQGKEFNFTFKDMGKVQTIRAYCGESSYNYYSSNVNGEDVYTDFTINVIEL